MMQEMCNDFAKRKKKKQGKNSISSFTSQPTSSHLPIPNTPDTSAHTQHTDTWNIHPSAQGRTLLPLSSSFTRKHTQSQTHQHFFSTSPSMLHNYHIAAHCTLCHLLAERTHSQTHTQTTHTCTTTQPPDDGYLGLIRATMYN